jgi:hypothetical protein
LGDVCERNELDYGLGTCRQEKRPGQEKRRIIRNPEDVLGREKE